MEKRLLSKEEKLAIINEAEQSGNITQVIRKYGIGYSLFYKWKHRYIAEGINGLEPRNRNKSNSRIGIYSSKEIDMMQVENQRLKKIVAEKELQIEMLQELLKKKKVGT
jgi:transposase-like protein